MAAADMQDDPSVTSDWFAKNAPQNTGVSGMGPGGTPPAAPQATETGAAPKSVKDPGAFRDAWFASPYPKNVDGLKQFVAAHPEFDATITGSKGSKVIIGGQAFQAVRSAGINGGIGTAWDPLGAADGSGGGGGGSNLGDFGSLAQGFTDKFSAPTAEEARNTPGYEFALNQGIDALDKRAAAQGTVLGGGEKKNVLAYATGLADQNYQQRYQNALGEYMNSYQIFRNNGNDIFNRFNTLADRGTSAANAATS